MSALLLSAEAVVSDTAESVVGTDHKHRQAGHSFAVVVLLPASIYATGFPLGNKCHMFSYSTAK